MVFESKLEWIWVFWGVGWGLWSKRKMTDTRNLASVTTFGTEVKHILALTPSLLCAMQLWTAVTEGEMIVCLHQMFMKNVMVQNAQQGTM